MQVGIRFPFSFPATPRSPEEAAWASVFMGFAIAGLFVWFLRSALRPGGSFEMKGATVPITREQAPLFWALAALHAAGAVFGLVLAVHGFVAVFRWTMR